MDKIRGFEKVSREEFLKDLLVTGVEYNELVLPHRKTAKSAGYDVLSPIDFLLLPGESIMIPTGFKAYMLDDEKLVFHVRSSHGFKKFIRLANTTGIGDSDYYNNKSNEGHYFVKLRNEGTETFLVNKGEAIAQCIFEKYLLADGDDFVGNERTGGFGSTG